MVGRSSDDKMRMQTCTSSQLDLRQILYEIKMNGEINYFRDLFRNEEIREIVNHVSRRNKCDKSILFNMLRGYVLNEYEYDKSEYCGERFLNEIKKVLGRKGREIIKKVITIE
jgi:hypothetical protein